MRILLIGLALLVASCVQLTDPARTSSSALNAPESPIARCMNLGSALEATYEGQWGYTVRREDLVRLKTAGFDTIRLPVRWSVHAEEDAPHTLDADMLARVEEIIGWADEIGLNIIVNVHHYSGLNREPDKHEGRLEAIWDQLSSHFVDAPDGLIFETINEPNGNMTVERTDALNVRLLARIREDHPTRWVILGTAGWGQLYALQSSRPMISDRLILTYHEYDPFDFTHQGAHWTDRTETGIRWGSRTQRRQMWERLDSAQAVQDRTGMPVFVGELGVFQNVPANLRARWTKTLREGIEARGMSWCYWDFAGELKAYDIESEAWLPELKSALLD